MTLPIVPGPFSFLATLGEAGGKAFEQAAKERERVLKEAQNRLNSMISLRSQGLIGPEAFGSPEAMKLYKTVGIEPITNQPTPGEQKSALTGDYLRNLGRPDQPSSVNIPLQSLGLGVDQQVPVAAKRQFTPEELRVIGVPTPDQIATEQLAGAQARATLPEVGTTTTAGQFTTQDKQFNDVADRVVEELYSKNKKLPSPEDAYAAAQTDQRYKAFGPDKITQPYFGSAVERLRAKLAAEETARRLAAARAAGAAGTGLDDLARIYQRNVDQFTNQLKVLGESMGITKNDSQIYSLYQTQKAAGKKVAGYIAERAAKYESYQRAAADLQSQIDQNMQKLNAVIVPAMGAAPPPGPQSLEQQRRDWDNLAAQYGAERTTKEIGPRPK